MPKPASHWIEGKPFADAAAAAARVTDLLDAGIGEDGVGRAVSAAVASASPDDALLGLTRLIERHPDSKDRFAAVVGDDAHLTRLMTVLGGSDYLSQVLLTMPELVWGVLAHDELGGERHHADHVRAIRAAMPAGASTDDLLRVLRVHKRREMLRIGARDLTTSSRATPSATACRRSTASRTTTRTARASVCSPWGSWARGS